MESEGLLHSFKAIVYSDQGQEQPSSREGRERCYLHQEWNVPLTFLDPGFDLSSSRSVSCTTYHLQKPHSFNRSITHPSQRVPSVLSVSIQLLPQNLLPSSRV